MKKIYDAAIKDLMKIMIPGQGGQPQGAAPAPHGIQVHIHGAGGAPEASGGLPSDLPEQASIGDLSASDSEMSGDPADKHKREMKALHARK